MVKHVTGGYKLTYHPDGPEGQGYEIDFTPPFKRISMTHDLEKEMGVKFPAADTYDSDGILTGSVCIKCSSKRKTCCRYSRHFGSLFFCAETRKFFDDLCAQKGVDCPPPRTTARLLDKVTDLICQDVTLLCIMVLIREIRVSYNPMVASLDSR